MQTEIAGVRILSRILVFRWRCPRSIARLTPSLVPQLRSDLTTRIRGEIRAFQVISEQVIQRAVGSVRLFVK